MKLSVLAPLVLIASGLLGAATAAAKAPLGEVSYITDRLVAARVADRIRKTCPTIGARFIRAYSEARALQDWALEKGYSREEVKTFLKDKAEKKKIYARAENYLAAHGATPENVEGFCALGRKEIAGGTIAGSLIYEK
ncbi:DUF5333 domain-containing protein [Frigidibacter sp. RF13]|uniref:DUF5333 domain-containing protein n=1 Tax=Frigidibacter sp. RF13 TaxID=2997340 RepID=UPI00226EA81C|nr:DUF5333 domain-containing protein [Frigidibacter sp. RF13]MCY1125929.1 DUF5333 domain-containing protein [Frigidibacter sp. RF13]